MGSHGPAPRSAPFPQCPALPRRAPRGSSRPAGGAALPACPALRPAPGMHRAGGLWRRRGRAGGGGAGPGPRPVSGNGAGDAPGDAAGAWLEAGADPGLLHASSPAVEERLRGLALVRGGFLREGEAAELLRELEPVLGRRPYQFDHWDGVRMGVGVTGGQGSGGDRGMGCL